jgi:hypothetical protein
MLRRPLLTLTAALAVCSLIPTSQARAQLTGGDPFTLYFGYYLPHQAAIAAQPTPLDTINQITAQRQFAAITDRAGLYDPISPYADEELDPLRPYSAKRGGERVAKPHTFASSTSNALGSGPALYYNRTARYYPGQKLGRGPNRNLAAIRSGRGGGLGGGASMPTSPSPGPR